MFRQLLSVSLITSMLFVGNATAFGGECLEAMKQKATSHKAQALYVSAVGEIVEKTYGKGKISQSLKEAGVIGALSLTQTTTFSTGLVPVASDIVINNTGQYLASTEWGQYIVTNMPNCMKSEFTVYTARLVAASLMTWGLNSAVESAKEHQKTK